MLIVKDYKTFIDETQNIKEDKQMIKRFFKAIGLIAVFGVSLCSLYLANLFLMKPASIDHYLGKELLTGMADSPESLTYIGIFDQFNWITKHNSKLSIPNPEDLQADIKDVKKTLKILNKYKDNSLTDNQKITKSIAIFDTENNLRQLEEFPYHDYPLNQVRGAHHNVISFMSDMHPIRSLSEAKDFIKRTNLVLDVHLGQLSWLEKQAAEGIYAPKFVYAHLIKQLNELINYSLEEHPLFTQFNKKAELLDIPGGELAISWRQT